MVGNRRCRPSALHLDHVNALDDSEVTRWPPRNEDLPVRRTFIDFGSLVHLLLSPLQSPRACASTAPARLGLSMPMQGAFDSWKAAASSASTSSTSYVAATPTGSSNSSAFASRQSSHSPTFQRFRQAAQSASHSNQMPRNSSHGPVLARLPAHSQRWNPPELAKRPIKLADEIGLIGADDEESSDDGESSEDGQGLCPAYSENAALPSAGSALHREGKCKRCCFFPKGRCSNGADCQYCHFAHEKRKTVGTRKKKGRRRRQRQTSLKLSSMQAGTMPTSSVQQILGDAMCSPIQKTSKLVVHSLQFVPTATLPGHSRTLPRMTMKQQCMQ
jgi:hypothetical protein